MNWRFWRKKKPMPENPRLVFELLDNGRINVSCNWSNMDDKMATRFAIMMHGVNSGKSMPAMIQAVAFAGQLKNDERTSQDILNILHSIPKSNQSHTGAVVPADEVFSQG